MKRRSLVRWKHANFTTVGKDVTQLRADLSNDIAGRRAVAEATGRYHKLIWAKIIMYDVKSIFASKTIWGGLLALAASAAAIWGYSISPADQAQIVELITGFGGAIGSVLAIYGRIVATKKIA